MRGFVPHFASCSQSQEVLQVYCPLFPVHLPSERLTSSVTSLTTTFLPMVVTLWRSFILFHSPPRRPGPDGVLHWGTRCLRRWPRTHRRNVDMGHEGMCVCEGGDVRCRGCWDRHRNLRTPNVRESNCLDTGDKAGNAYQETTT